MKKSLNLIISASLLGGALAFTGCSEAPKSEPAAPAATPLTAAPVEEAKPTGDLGKAKESLEKAVTELKAQNYTAAVSSVDAASKELTAMAANSSLPAPIKETIAKASTNLEPIKALIEKKDASAETNAEKGLMASIASLGKLSEMTKLMGGGMTDAAKGAAAGAAGALGGMMKSAAGKTGAAAGTAAEKAGEMMPKKN